MASFEAYCFVQNMDDWESFEAMGSFHLPQLGVESNTFFGDATVTRPWQPADLG